MQDRAIRGMAAKNQIRFFAVDSTNTVKEAASAHKLSVAATLLLGRMMSASIMLGMDLKDERSSVTLKLDCDGPLAGATVVSRNMGRVKGYVKNTQAELVNDSENPQFAIKIGPTVGNGTLSIIKDLNVKQPFTGQVKLISGEIGDDLAYYFLQSEQIPSAVGLGILVNPDLSIRTSGGFIVQLMPFTDDDTIVQLEDNIKNMPNISDLLDMGKSIEDIVIEFVLKNFDMIITDELEPTFYCDCSKEKFRSGLKLLGKEELIEVLNEDGKLETNCRFCNSTYTYYEKDLKDIIKELK